MAGKVVSSREMEEAVRRAAKSWSRETGGAITMRARCTRCWRGKDVHPQSMQTPETCELEVLTSQEYFEELKDDLAMAEEMALYCRRGKEKTEIAEEMERHIQKLERRLGEGQESGEDQQPRRRRHADVDASDWTTEEEGEEEEQEEPDGEGVGDPS